MRRRFSARAGRSSSQTFIAIFSLCTLALLPGSSALAERTLADRANETSREEHQAAYTRVASPSDYQPLYGIHYVRTAADCQVPLPPIGAVSPFPLALRLGAMVSPRVKFDGGIDATIRGFHLLPGFTSRVDADAIVSANFGGITTIVPVTFDQIYNLNLPVSSRVYLGGGVGPYFGDRTRFGGKLIAGAEFNRIGLEGNVHFSGAGQPLLTVQARLGL